MRQSGRRRRRQCSRGGASSSLGGEMTERGGEAGGRGENNTRVHFTSVFRDKRFAEYLDARQNEPREKQTAFFQPPILLYIYTCVYVPSSPTLSPRSREGGGKRDNCSRIRTRGTYVERHANTLSCFFAATTRVCYGCSSQLRRPFLRFSIESILVGNIL